MNFTCSLATVDDIPAIIDFCKANFVETWQFCAGVRPFPNPSEFQFYIERGNPCILAYDEQGMASYRIVSRDPDEHAKALWGLARSDMNDESPELTELAAEITAYAWAVVGCGPHPEDPVAPEVGDTVAAVLNATMDRALEIYNEKYA